MVWFLRWIVVWSVLLRNSFLIFFSSFVLISVWMPRKAWNLKRIWGLTVFSFRISRFVWQRKRDCLVSFSSWEARGFYFLFFYVIVVCDWASLVFVLGFMVPILLICDLHGFLRFWFGVASVLPPLPLVYYWGRSGGLEENGNLTSMWLSGGLFFPGHKHEAL